MLSVKKDHGNSTSNGILEVRNLSFRYGRKQPAVLRDISASFSKSRLTIIAGPNGSGKTTLMKHFNGLILPQQGEVFVFGNSVTKKNRKTIQKMVGLVFQNPDEQIFYPKVYDDIAFGPRNMKLSGEEVEERVTTALEEVNITHLKNRITFNLSFGEKKKVAFAGMLAMQPEVIILDEPTIGIDPWSKPKMIEIIKSFRAKRTVIVITHDFEMMKIADRIVLLKDGEIKGDFPSFNDFYEQEFIQ
ncbi:MAG: ABC transporter ATP-binding protein [Candidatus Heimdallarchaeota archaeon]|nr:MAG: ABC transporter ATP-binding protein [Candidatus Heimdallarchaeota archaeon]